VQGSPAARARSIEAATRVAIRGIEGVGGEVVQAWSLHGVAAMRRVASVLAIAVATGCGVSGYDHGGELGALAGGKADGPAAPRKGWTFVLYGAADNNLADDIRADINELESVGSTEDVNLLAFLDRPEGASVYYLLDDDDRVALRSPSTAWGKVDSGDVQTLIDVAGWATERFPADHVALVISGHGGGTPRVIAPDFSTGNAIDMQSLERGLSSLAAATGSQLDLFGADACLMQTVEVAYQLRHQTRVIVGSANTEPGTGWDYARIANVLLEGTPGAPTTALDLAIAMVGYYARDYQRDLATVSLSALDTDALDEPRSALLHDLAAAIAQHALTDAGRAELRAIAYGVKRVSADDPDFADALDLMKRLEASTSPEVRTLARSVEIALDTPDSLAGPTPGLLIVGWGGGAALSIYFPVSAKTLEAYAAQNAFAGNGWAGAIRSIWSSP
jgi:hypothetical protein